MGQRKPKISFLVSILKIITKEYYEKFLMGINNSTLNNINNNLKLINFTQENIKFKNKNLAFILSEDISLFLNYLPVIRSTIHEDFYYNNVEESE